MNGNIKRELVEANPPKCITTIWGIILFAVNNVKHQVFMIITGINLYLGIAEEISCTKFVANRLGKYKVTPKEHCFRVVLCFCGE